MATGRAEGNGGTDSEEENNGLAESLGLSPAGGPGRKEAQHLISPNLTQLGAI